MGYFISEKIMEGLTRIVCPGNVYAFLIEGKDSAVLIDTGFGVGSLKQFIDSLTSLPYEVILTHGHLDHAGGAAEFEKVYLNDADLEVARTHTTLEKRSPGFCSEEGGFRPEDMIPMKPLEEYLPLVRGQSFDLGGRTVTMYALPGHTPGSMCVLIEELRVMILGDACNSLGYMFLPESLDVETYAKAMREFAGSRDLFDTVLYSHPHNFGGKEIIDETIRLCDEILSGKRTGVPRGTTPEGVRLLIAKAVDDQDHPLDGGCANFIYREN